MRMVPTSAIPANKAWYPYSSPSKWITPWRLCLPTRPSAKSTQKTCFKTVRVTFRPRYLPVLDSPSGSYAPLLHGRVRYWIIGPENGSKAGFPWHTVGCTVYIADSETRLSSYTGCRHLASLGRRLAPTLPEKVFGCSSTVRFTTSLQHDTNATVHIPRLHRPLWQGLLRGSPCTLRRHLVRYAARPPDAVRALGRSVHRRVLHGEIA